MAIPDSFSRWLNGFVFDLPNLTSSQLATVFASAGYDTDIGTSWALRVLKAPLCVLSSATLRNLQRRDEPFEIRPREIDGSLTESLLMKQNDAGKVGGKIAETSLRSISDWDPF